MRSVSAIGLGIALSVFGCGDNSGNDPGQVDACAGGNCVVPDAPVFDAAPPDAIPPEYPLTIDQTGLCSDPECMVINPAVYEYSPRWPLWSDTASKRRWIYLPSGTTIDTTDMDNWIFPVGTKLWKDFTRDGIRVETRYMVKTGDNNIDWKMISYLWNSEQNNAEPTILAVPNANGTEHDVPSRSNCRQCHEETPGRVLGFGALQLDFDGQPGELDLADTIALGWLSAPPTIVGAGTVYFPLPANPVAIEAFGFLHANCGGCHNQLSNIVTPAPLMDLRMHVGQLASLETMPSYSTTVGVPAAQPRIIANDSANSLLYQKITSEVVTTRMPPLGTEIVNVAGTDKVAAFINQLP